MPLYLPDDPEFAELETRHRWFEHVLAAAYGELEDDEPVPEALDWLAQVPPERWSDFETAECSLACVEDDGAVLTIWDATGVEDDPWAVFVVDAYGPRLLPEYSVFDPDTDEAQRAAVLRRASDELPDRLLAGAFDRAGDPVPIPDGLNNPIYRETE